MKINWGGNNITDGIMPNKITLEHLVKDTLWHPVSFIKKELFNKFGLYNTDYEIVADYDFFFKNIIINKSSIVHLNCFIVLGMAGDGIALALNSYLNISKAKVSKLNSL